MSGPTVKFGLDHPQKLLKIIQVAGSVGRFGLVKPGHCSKNSPIYTFSGDTFKIVIDSVKNEIQTFLYSVIFRGSNVPPSIKIRPGDPQREIVSNFRKKQNQILLYLYQIRIKLQSVSF